MYISFLGEVKTSPVFSSFIVGDIDTHVTKLLQKSEMRKDIVIELSYRGFSCTSDYS